MKEFYGLLSEAFRAENMPTYELDGGALHGPSPPPQASKGLDIRHFHVARVPIDHVGVKHPRPDLARLPDIELYMAGPRLYQAQTAVVASTRLCAARRPSSTSVGAAPPL